MTRIDQTLMLRAQEIAQNSDEIRPMSEALKQAALERYKDLDSMAAAFATLGAQALNGMRKRQYELPDDATMPLFDIPSGMLIDTPDAGPLWVPKEEATKAHVEQYLKEGLKLHSSQRLRFKRALEDFELAEDLDDDTPWTEVRSAIRERKLEALESDE